MKAEAFLQLVKRSMPDRSQLAAHGLDEEEIRDIQSLFVAPARGVAAPQGVTELERMIIEFDCSKLTNGPVRFNDRLEVHAPGKCFALCEADPLVILPDGRVGLVDHAVPDRVHEFCAASPDQFLDALALDKRGDQSSIEALAEYANAAGGLEYTDFYRMFLPYDS